MEKLEGVKKILYIINGIKRSGPNTVLNNMVRALDKTEFDVYVVAFLDKNEENEVKKLEKYGAKCIFLNYPNKRSILKSGRRNVTKLINKLHPHIIHSHGIFADYVNAKLHTKAKKISTVHNLPFEDYVNRFGRLKGGLMAKWHVSMYRKLGHVVGCSETSYNHLKQYLHSSNLTFVRNGINGPVRWKKSDELVREKIRQQYGIKNNNVVYIFAGGLVRGKNIRFLVDNFKKTHLKNEKLLIVGGGVELEYCNQQKDESIILAGYQSNMRNYFCAGDIYISASKSEGFSISILEALERGLTLFLSDIPAHKEILSIDKNAHVGRAFTETTFKRDIIRLRQEYNRQVAKKQVIAFKNKYFTAKHMINRYIPYYEGPSNEV